MARTGYSAVTQADVALAAATPKSVLGVLAPAAFGVDLTKFRIGLLGNTSGQVPARVELCYATFATNSPGTNSNLATVRQVFGRAIVAGFTAAYDWSAEPTALSVIESWPIPTTGGLVIYDFPEGQTPDTDVDDGFVLRVTCPTIVNVRASLYFGRC